MCCSKKLVKLLIECQGLVSCFPPSRNLAQTCMALPPRRQENVEAFFARRRPSVQGESKKKPGGLEKRPVCTPARAKLSLTQQPKNVLSNTCKSQAAPASVVSPAQPVASASKVQLTLRKFLPVAEKKKPAAKQHSSKHKKKVQTRYFEKEAECSDEDEEEEDESEDACSSSEFAGFIVSDASDIEGSNCSSEPESNAASNQECHQADEHDAAGDEL